MIFFFPTRSLQQVVIVMPFAVAPNENKSNGNGLPNVCRGGFNHFNTILKFQIPMKRHDLAFN